MFKFEIHLDALDVALLAGGAYFLLRRYKRKHKKPDAEDPAVKAEMKDGDIVLHIAH